MAFCHYSSLIKVLMQSATMWQGTCIFDISNNGNDNWLLNNNYFLERTHSGLRWQPSWFGVHRKFRVHFNISRLCKFLLGQSTG